MISLTICCKRSSSKEFYFPINSLFYHNRINLYEPFAAYATRFKVVPVSIAGPPRDPRSLKPEGPNPMNKKLSGNRSESKFDIKGKQARPQRTVDRSMELPKGSSQYGLQNRPRKESLTKPVGSGIVNKVIEEKMRKEMEEKIKEEEREQRRQQRLQEIERDIKLLKEKKKEEAELKIEREQNHIIKQENAAKLKEELRRKELEKKKELLQQYKEKKQAEINAQIQLDRQRRQEQELQKKKEAEQFIGSQKKKFVI